MAGRIRRISQSSIKLWSKCPLAWAMRHVHGVRTTTPRRPLSVGSLTHEGVAGYRQAVQSGEDAASALAWALSAISVAHDVARDRLAAAGGTEADEAALRSHAELAAALVARYVDRWHSVDSEDWEILAVEDPWEVSIRTPRGRKSHTRLVGKIDGLARRRRDGSLWILETKTTSASTCDGYVLSSTATAGQPLAYVWALREAGHDVRGVIYDVIRSRLPAAPKPLKAKRGGRSFSTQGDMESAALEAAALAAGDDLEAYAERLAELRAGEDGRWFAREAFVPSDEQIASWLSDMDAERRTYGRPPYPRRRDGCEHPYPCEWLGLCSMGWEPGDDLPAGYYTEGCAGDDPPEWQA